MSIIIKKDKKKVNYFIYISLFAFILVIVWFFYSKWIADQEFLKKNKNKETVDVTEGLADIKADEANKVLENEKYMKLSNPAIFNLPVEKGKNNPFSGF